MKNCLKLVSSFLLLVASPLSAITIACKPPKISQDNNDIYNLTFGNPVFKNSSPIDWSTNRLARTHNQNTNFFDLLSGQGSYSVQAPDSYFYQWKHDVADKLKAIYDSIKNANSEPIFGDGVQLAKTVERYSSYSVNSSPSYVSNYTRMINQTLSDDINPANASWWKPVYHYHGQNWRVIFQNLFAVFQKYNTYLAQPSHSYQNYFSVFLRYVDNVGYTSNISDFHFFVKMMDLYKVLFGLLSPRAVARLVGNFIFDPQTESSSGRTINEETNTGRLETNMIFFGHDFNRKTDEDTYEYKLGWSSTLDQAKTLVHEFGHALGYLLWYAPDKIMPSQQHTSRKYLNWIKLPTGYAYGNFNFSPWDYFVSAVGNDVWQELLPHIKPSSTTLDVTKLYSKYATYINTIITYSIVRSNYGRTFSSSDKRLTNGEIQPEAFAEWILTPKSQRSQGWQVLDHIFGGLQASSFINEYDGHNRLES